MHALKRLTAGLAVTGGLLASATGAASASPIRVTGWTPEIATCGDTTPHVVILVPGAGPFTPLFLDTRQSLVPYQVRFNAVGGDGELKARHGYKVGDTLTKPASMPAHTVTCEISGYFVADGTEHDFTATMTGVLH